MSPARELIQSNVRPTFRQLVIDANADLESGGKREGRRLTEPVPAQLTDLYVERVAVAVIDASRSEIELKAENRLRINLPILIECEGLLITGNVRHCMKAAGGGYVVGMKIFKVVEAPAKERNDWFRGQ